MENYMDNFVIFILTYNRPDNQITLKTLKNLDYKGKVYLVVDDSDPALQDYLDKYGDNVIIFNKPEALKEYGTDLGDNLSELNSAVIARNYCFKLAKELGYDYFCEFDDDYRYIAYRYVEGSRLRSIEDLPCFDNIINSMINFMVKSDADCVAFSQGGDYIGGAEANILRKRLLRKIMNGFFLRTDRPLKFRGRQNDDVNLFVLDGSRGKLFLTPCEISLGQLPTQKNPGGSTELYGGNTYVKSFYSVMFSPSNVRITAMGDRYYRIHHKILKEQTYPKILSEKYKKR